jgi:hypothetical protein
MKKKWNNLKPCEKKVATVCGVLAVACLVAAKVIEVKGGQKNGQ